MKFIGKYLLSLLLFLAIAAAGCSGGGGGRFKDWMRDSDKKKILCTTAQIGDLVTQIGGERVDNWVLIQGDLDPHSYELVKGDDEKLFRADHIFYNGLGLEHGASLSAALRASPKSTPLGESIARLAPERILKKGDVVDPHIWMDISLWKLSIDPIVDELSAVDPEGAGYYQGRGRLLAERMDAEHAYLQELMSKVPSHKRYLMTSHDAFRYFTRGYLAGKDEADWASRFAAPEGLAPDGQLNPQDIRRMIEFLRKTKITVLFPESNVNRDSIQKIASAGGEMGLTVKICSEPLYGDSMSGLSYFEMMHRNGETLSRYLQ